MPRLLVEYGSFKNKRENNEDNFYINSVYMPQVRSADVNASAVFDGEERAVFGVFDGLGGEERGETASFLAAAVLEGCQDIKGYYEKANSEITDFYGGHRGGGAAAVILEIKDGSFSLSNLGDSRGYLIRNGEIKRLSKDHTMASLLIENGAVTEEEAKRLRFKNSLNRYLGAEKGKPEPYFSPKKQVLEGDIFLLCSDGLTSDLREDEIKDIILESPEDKAVLRLYEAAAEAGAKDNITAALIYAKKAENKEKYILLGLGVLVLIAVVVLILLVKGVILNV